MGEMAMTAACSDHLMTVAIAPHQVTLRMCFFYHFISTFVLRRHTYPHNVASRRQVDMHTTSDHDTLCDACFLHADSYNHVTNCIHHDVCVGVRTAGQSLYAQHA